jgi:hypothetical protein
MILNQVRTPVWAWDGKAESKCPMCGEPLVARRCQDRVWHWAHKPHTNQKEGTCLFDDSEWALQWRLGYHMFPGWQIEVPKKDGTGQVHLVHAINPKTRQVREFVSHINDKLNPRFNFLANAQSHQVCWMFNGNEWVRNGANAAAQGGFRDFLKPKAQKLYDAIFLNGQNALVHIPGPGGGTLYREWIKTMDKATGKPLPQPERTGIWFPLTGEAALAVLNNFSKVTLPYDNAKSEKPAPAKPAAFNNLMARV